MMNDLTSSESSEQLSTNCESWVSLSTIPMICRGLTGTESGNYEQYYLWKVYYISDIHLESHWIDYAEM